MPHAAEQSFWDILQDEKVDEAIRYKKVWKGRPYITKEEFESVPKEDRIEILADLALYLIDFEDSPCDERRFAALPELLRIACGVHGLECYVNQDGFSGYFTCWTSIMAFDTLQALRKIGATENLAILTDALAAINTGGKSDEELKRALIAEEIEELYDSDEMDQKLHELDNRFYDSKEQLRPLAEAYIADHFDAPRIPD